MEYAHRHTKLIEGKASFLRTSVFSNQNVVILEQGTNIETEDDKTTSKD
jgi:hypothetical protein